MSIPSRYRLLVAVLLQWLVALLLAGTAHAATTHIAAELVAEGPAEPGGTTSLAIHMRPDPGWHGYWLNPGDAGFGMELDWDLPDHAKVGEPRYPVPQTLLVAGLMNHVYVGDYAVIVPLTVPKDAKQGDVLPVAVDAKWLACTDKICVPEQERLATRVTIGKPAIDPAFERWRQRLPAPLGAQARYEIAGDTIRLGIPLPARVKLEDPHVFVAEDGVVDYSAPQIFNREGDMLVVELRRPGFEPLSPAKLKGLLRLDKSGAGLSFAAVKGSVPAGGTPIDEKPDLSSASLPMLLLGAVFGGLLLNIMPCVFPILSLKALSLARAGESEAHARIEGLAYAAGVILAAIGLGGLLLVLRAAGEEVGWAFQLQEPGVVAALLLLAVAITANFLGVFEFAVPGFAEEGSARGAFATGLLAAFVATPCTGPFMAAAMGAALLLPVLPALALFAALGIGIALPFLAVAFVPALRARLPKPGPWMTRFRRWMALPMGLTALALAWLASRVGGAEFAVASCVLAAMLLVLLAITGRRQRSGKHAFGLSALGLATIALAGFLFLPRTVMVPTISAPGVLDARPFSEAALAQARASGKPVFAWFTADWCITCKVNEEVAIEREATKKAFARAGVVVLRGDWTRRDPEITRYLTARGAAGVPLYDWYPAGGGKVEKLPQVLTQETLLELANGAR